MSETQRLIAEMAARFMVASIEQGTRTDEGAYAHQCLALAKIIVKGVAQ